MVREANLKVRVTRAHAAGGLTDADLALLQRHLGLVDCVTIDPPGGGRSFVVGK